MRRALYPVLGLMVAAAVSGSAGPGSRAAAADASALMAKDTAQSPLVQSVTYYHERWRSHWRWGSGGGYHERWRSHNRWGSGGGYHERWRSHNRWGSGGGHHERWRSHNRWGSGGGYRTY